MSPADYQDDIDRILALERVNGAEFWATPEGGISKGGPFSTVEVCTILTELGHPRSSRELVGAANLIFSKQREDGRIPTGPSGAIYPCQTAAAARALCHLGYAGDSRLQVTYAYFLNTLHSDGGWRCNAFKYGKGPETEFSNPGPTLSILDIFRHTPYLNCDERLDRAALSLLDHWETRKPRGPCHFGIGTLFMKIEYPMFRYNLFGYVHTLSSYEIAKRDGRFLSALAALEERLVDGQVVVENPHGKLRDFKFCMRGEKSELATNRYQGLLMNLNSAKRAPSHS